VVAALAFLTSRDDATTTGALAQAPGRPWPGPADADLRAGNVEVVVVDAQQVAVARRVADAVTGSHDPALRAAGQAVLVTRCVAGACPPAAVTAYAQDRILEAQRADDPRLQAFLEYWVGRVGG
jgi:hypothetical protein